MHHEWTSSYQTVIMIIDSQMKTGTKNSSSYPIQVHDMKNQAQSKLKSTEPNSGKQLCNPNNAQ